MLVLSRKCGEEIVIGSSITIRVTQCENGRVRLGIDAPTHVQIARGEIVLDGPPAASGRRDDP